jgi:uncharacterized protein YybS (DUF2232 family)
VLAIALFSTVFFRKTGIPALEMIAWNMVTICLLLYLAQGLGIILYYLSKTARSTFTRLFQALLAMAIIMSPGINLIACGGVLVLGIAENWASFRRNSNESKD